MTDVVSHSAASPKPRGRAKLLLVLAVCASPVIASYFMYYVVKPEGRTNYGTLVQPQRPMPPLTLTELDGKPFDLATLKGKWLMITVDGGACTAACEDKLVHMRQVRLTTGRERDRVERVWFITDKEPLPTLLMRQHDGLRMVRADPKELAAWLPATSGTTLPDHLFMVDPLGNLMLRWPQAADPNQTKKDLSKLLRASRVG